MSWKSSTCKVPKRWTVSFCTYLHKRKSHYVQLDLHSLKCAQDWRLSSTPDICMCGWGFRRCLKLTALLAIQVQRKVKHDFSLQNLLALIWPAAAGPALPHTGEKDGSQQRKEREFRLPIVKDILRNDTQKSNMCLPNHSISSLWSHVPDWCIIVPLIKVRFVCIHNLWGIVWSMFTGPRFQFFNNPLNKSNMYALGSLAIIFLKNSAQWHTFFQAMSRTEGICSSWKPKHQISLYPPARSSFSYSKTFRKYSYTMNTSHNTYLTWVQTSIYRPIDFYNQNSPAS